jgi:hypothetical protein
MNNKQGNGYRTSIAKPWTYEQIESGRDSIRHGAFQDKSMLKWYIEKCFDIEYNTPGLGLRMWEDVTRYTQWYDFDMFEVYDAIVNGTNLHGEYNVH